MIVDPIGIETDLWQDHTIHTHIWINGLLVDIIRYLAVTGVVKMIRSITGNILNYRNRRIYTGV